VQNNGFFAGAQDASNIFQKPSVDPLVEHNSSAWVDRLLTGGQLRFVVEPCSTTLLNFRVALQAVKHLSKINHII